jgi:hypothetical protein
MTQRNRDRGMMMSKRLGLTVVAASFLFGPAPGFAGSVSKTSSVQSLATASPGHDDLSARLASMGRAPVGHRQPRQSDVPQTTQLSPDDLELRRLDEEIDRKLIICHGC